MSQARKVQKKAQAIIERARREQSTDLNLSGYRLDKRLREIPDEVFALAQLETVNLSENSIKEIPEGIRDLPNLRRLHLTRNPIDRVVDIPGLVLDLGSYLRCQNALSRENVFGISIDIDREYSISRQIKVQVVRELTLLPNLRHLRIGLHSIYNDSRLYPPAGEVLDIIKNIDQFPSLEELIFSGVLLESLPLGIRNLKKLRRLSVDTAGLREVPGWLDELSRLCALELSFNSLITLPDCLAKLSDLRSISLANNPFAKFPEVLFRVPGLRDLHLGAIQWREHREGRIRQIPSQILQLQKLEELDVTGQPIEIPPPEIVKEGVAAIKNYWRQQQEVGVDYLCEAKLIIVGEAGAGKTTLAKKIQNPDYTLAPQEHSTEGIDVACWSFPSAIRVKRDGREELHYSDFTVNIWDFGGQEIYHATHQFFLTRRSLYALVADDRKEDTDFNYWLQVVELLSDRSPLLIIQNEKQDRQREIDLGKLRADFPSLREAFRINLATNRGLSELERAIRQELEYLPHIGTPLPKTWSRVRAALEGDSRDYISLEEYLTICQEHGFERREDKLQLSGYLHDLGICLHFQDDPVLKNIVILKPKWGTDAVYGVLDDRAILDQRGRFSPKDLARIWSDEAYASMRDELLRLMMRFQLCYQLPDTQAYIAPQLLSPTRPAYEWEGRGGLVLRYDYEFMPKGILTRFIVAVNHLIADQDLVWKSGVILEREGSRAEVMEDYPRRKITVRVSGGDVRVLLAIVDDQLERIHASFPRLKYDKFLPCNCEVCQARDEPFAYPLSELKDFAVQGDRIQCRTSRRMVDARHLIRDVLPAFLLEELTRHGGSRHEAHPPGEPSPRKEVFVSYARTGESTALVDKLQEALAGCNIALLRDQNEIRYKDSIRDFMKRIGRGKCIVVILSRKYLESPSCMFEMTEIAGRGEVRNRVFPVVLDDAGIHSAISRVRYVRYWEEKKEELDAAMKGVGGEDLQGIREELDLFARIRSTIAGIVDILGDMNALSPGQHEGAGFGTLVEALEARLGE
jgi:internalin A